MSREGMGRFMNEKAGAKADRPRKESVIGERLADVDNHYGGGSSRRAMLTKQPHKPGYALGSLAVARAAFVAKTKLAADWPDA